MKRRFAAAALALLFSAALFSTTSARAEIRKLMNVTDGKLIPKFEMILTPPKDWVEEKEASKANGVQMMVPRGKDYHSAPALMYVKVSYRRDKEQTVEQFVENSQKRWRENVSDTKIDKLADVERTDGRPAYLSYRYENPSRPQQRFEAVSFALDSDKDGNDFFVMVALTGKGKKEIDQAMTAYNAFLKEH
jgi:hypothetical protein